MKANRWIVAGAIALVFIVAVPLVYAQRMHAANGMAMHQGMGMHGGSGLGPLAKIDRLRQELNLTDDQVSQLKAIATSVRDQNAPYRQQVRGTMHDAVKLLLKDPNDIAGAQAILDSQAAAEKSLRQNMLRGVSQGLNVLTPEQRQKLTDILAARAAKHGQTF